MFRTLALAVLLLAAALPPAAAVPVVHTTFGFGQADYLPAPLRPDTGILEVTIPWTYAADNQAGAAVLAASETATLSWKTASCADRGLAVEGPTAETIDLWPDGPAAAPPPRIEGKSVFRITSTMQAPGETVIKCTFVGQVLSPEQSAGTVADSNEATTEIGVTVAYVGVSTVEAPARIAMAGPQKAIRYDLQVTNLGNSLTQYRFELLEALPEGWNAVPPAPVMVGSVQQGAAANEAVVAFVVQTPYQEGWNEGETQVKLRVVPTSARDTSQAGPAMELTFVARVQGYYCSTPATCDEVARELRADCPPERTAECEEGLANLQALDADANASPAAGPLVLGALIGLALLLRRRMA